MHATRTLALHTPRPAAWLRGRDMHIPVYVHAGSVTAQNVNHDMEYTCASSLSSLHLIEFIGLSLFLKLN
jgi:hypothetical protein